MKTIKIITLLIGFVLLFSQCRKESISGAGVDNISDTTLFLSGKLVDCNNVPVSNGDALLDYNGSRIVIACNSAGYFSTTLRYPNANNIQSCQITGVNITTLQQGNAVNVSFASPVNGVINVGNIVACGTPLSDYINYSIDGGASKTIFNAISGNQGNIVSYIINDDPNYPGNIITISGSKMVPGVWDYICFFIMGNPTTTGAYPIGTFSIYGFDPKVDDNYNTINAVQPLNVTITNYPQNVGDYFVGSFSGQFTDSQVGFAYTSGTVHTISCSFKVARAADQ
jgi:hypothetical protein